MNFITTLSDDVLLAELGQRLAQLRQAIALSSLT